YVSIPSGSCVPVSSVFSALNSSKFIRINCGRSADVKAHFQSVLAVATSKKLSDSVSTESLSAAYLQHWRNSSLITTTSTGGSTTAQYYSYVVRRSNGVTTTSSVHPAALESHAPGSLDFDIPSRPRVLIQTSPDLFSPSRANNYFPFTSAIETSTYKSPVNVSSTGYGPRDGDLPLGCIYNRFNTSEALSSEAAAADSARYYDINASRIDMGSWYGQTSSVSDGDGFTITMYLRATATSQGFAFAVTDALEDIVDRNSPILDKAIDMLTRNSPPDSWFSDAFHIYSALYVNGPSLSLHFVHADPTTLVDGSASASATAGGTRFVNVRWELDALGLTHLFNGLWHHVAVVLRTENDQTKAQLIVDGVTSLSKSGWNQCMARRPTAIQNVSAGSTVPAYSASTDRFVSGGMLYAGYFNGGIGHLRFRNESVNIFTLWRESTAAIQQHNAISTAKYYALGYCLIVVAVVLAAVTVLQSGRDLVRTHAADEKRMFSKADLEYSKVMKLTPLRYLRPPLATVVVWLGVNGEQALELLEELGATRQRPGDEFVRIMFNAYNRSHASKSDPFVPLVSGLPDVHQWNELVERECGVTRTNNEHQKATPLRAIPVFDVTPNSVIPIVQD
ncbi:transmembrane protein, putative, partial [Bodo saltans]